MANHNPPANGFKKGNQFYKTCNPGRKKSFDTPAQLWAAACTYFEHCTDDLVELWLLKGEKLVIEYRMLPMSWRGLYLYIGVNDLKHYKTLSEFTEVLERISNVFYVHNFGCAANGILDGRFVASTLK